MQTLARGAKRPKTAQELVLWLFFRAVLFAVAGGYCLPVLHLAAVTHEICAEHGALEHVHVASEVSSPSPSKNAEASAATASSHEHERCGVVGISSSSALAAQAALSVAVTLKPVPAAALCEAPARANVAVLSYAPKLAPPA